MHPHNVMWGPQERSVQQEHSIYMLTRKKIISMIIINLELGKLTHRKISDFRMSPIVLHRTIWPTDRIHGIHPKSRKISKSQILKMRLQNVMQGRQERSVQQEHSTHMLTREKTDFDDHHQSRTWKINSPKIYGFSDVANHVSSCHLTHGSHPWDSSKKNEEIFEKSQIFKKQQNLEIQLSECLVGYIGAFCSIGTLKLHISL